MVAVGAQALIPDARPAGEGVLRRGCVSVVLGSNVHTYLIYAKPQQKLLGFLTLAAAYAGEKGATICGCRRWEAQYPLYR